MRQSASLTAVFDQLTLQWVVETGKPMLDATTTVTAEASSMLKPLQGKKKKTKKHLRLWACLLNSKAGNVCRGCGFMTKGGIGAALCVISVPWGGDRREVPAHGLDYSAAPHPKSSADAHTAIQQEPNGCRFTRSHAARLVNQPQSYQRSNGITVEERMRSLQEKKNHLQHARETKWLITTRLFKGGLFT